ncbi:hypothetical protein [Herminiimonas sp. CN]|uniref:hypothetical protein n=1 Tax=Herminiimonas sp. CN TaxID=1349818 RepID=UPI0012DE9BE6|nr:hypothetical protein [Herminiimonas sp. CN]
MNAPKMKYWLTSRPGPWQAGPCPDPLEPEDGTDAVWADLARTHPVTRDQEKDLNDE